MREIVHDYIDLGRRAEDAEIVPGMVGTYGIGGDAYAEVIVEVRRFKSGPRKGLVREIDTVPLRPVYDAETRTFSEKSYAAERIIETPYGDHRNDRTYTARYDEPRRPEDPVRFRPVGSGRWSGFVPGYARDYRDPSY